VIARVHRLAHWLVVRGMQRCLRGQTAPPEVVALHPPSRPSAIEPRDSDDSPGAWLLAQFDAAAQSEACR